MENQHRKITGYRELTQEDIDLINEIKAQGESLDKLVARITSMLNVQVPDLFDESSDTSDYDTWHESKQWLYEGKLSLKKGLMFLTCAVARPTSF